MTIRLSLLIFLLATISSADQASSVRRREQEDLGAQIRGRVINGAAAGAGQFPWFVVFESGSCGGTLISEDRVLTSATCIRNQYPERVRVGASTSSDGTLVKVRCSNIHPDYYRSDAGIYNDVAIIKLQDDVDNVQVVRLNSDPSYPVYNEQVFTTMGFGFTSNNGPLSDTLQVAQLSLLTTFDCQALYPEMSVSGAQHVCAQSPAVGICTGDSGGPLMDGDSSNSIQVGVTSFTFDGCASDAYPDVYAKVATYSSWIQSEIESDFCRGMVFSEAPSAAPTPPPVQPTTPQPTNAPTKAKEPCLFDRMGNLLGGMIPFLGGAEDDVGSPYYQEEIEQETEGKGSFWMGLVDALVGGNEEEEEAAEEDKKGSGKGGDKPQKDGKGGKTHKDDEGGL